MDDSTRRRIAEYVKPLAVGLDGVTNYGDVERAVSAAEEVATGRSEVDPDLLFLLAVFSGQTKWVMCMGHRSRTEIFLGSMGVSRKTIDSLFRGLGRLQTAPVTPEEEIVHDAVRLDELGAYGIVRSLIEGHRERMDFLEMARSIEDAAEVPLRTERASALAAPRRAAMREFARKLQEEFREFQPASSKPRSDGR